MDDWDILDLFFTRSEQAIVELDAKYGAIFHALAYNILASREDADECVNDAYLGRLERHPAGAAREALGLGLPRRAQRGPVAPQAGQRDKARRKLRPGPRRAGGRPPSAGQRRRRAEAEELTREIERFLVRQRRKPRHFPAPLLVFGQPQGHRQAHGAQ